MIKNKLLLLEECKKLAKEKDGEFLGDSYIYSLTKYAWKCNNKNHEIFYANHNNVKTKNSWCPKCASERNGKLTTKRLNGVSWSEERKKTASIKAKELSFGSWMKDLWKDKTSVYNTEEYRKKLMKRKLPHTEETKKKISEANMGKNNGMYNKTHTNESKKKISERSIELHKESNYIKRMREFYDSTEGKMKLRNGALKAYKILSDKGFYNTKPELLMKEILDVLQIEYIHPYEITNIEHKYFADFYISKNKVVLEVDGLYWHNYPNGRDLDKIRNVELVNAGYKILRFWENKFDKDIVKNELEKY